MKKTTKNKTLTPEQYIRQKARTLPLGQSYMNKNWFISGIGIAVITRCHKMGTYTTAIFQIDTFCTGLVECKIEFSQDKTAYQNMINYLINTFKIEPVTYQEAHNLIYGAVEFGEEAGFSAPTSFHLAKCILEEDTEDIPLISYQYGKFGKHFLWADSISELDTYMPHLINHLGKENVLFGLVGNDRCFRGEDFYDSKTRELMYNIASKISQHKECPIETYSYVHPQYPTELKLKHAELKEILYSQENYLQLADEKLKAILELPHEELREDLEQIMLYETGRTCDTISEEQYRSTNSVLIHCFILLGELGYKESLPTVLEVLSQNKAYFDYHFGIVLNEICVPTIYLLAKDQLDKLYEFVQKPGLYTFARYLIFPAVVQIVEHEPERREEVIEWFKKVLNFYTANIDNNYCCDGSLAGLITIDLIRLQATEVLPELKQLFETGKVDEQCCGNFANVEKQMKETNTYNISYLFHATEQYKAMETNHEQLVSRNAEILKAALSELLAAREQEVQEAEEVPASENPTAEHPAAEEKETKTSQTKKTTAKAAATKKAKTTKKAEESKDTKAKKVKADAEVDETATETKTVKKRKTCTKKSSTSKKEVTEDASEKKKAEEKKPAEKKTKTTKAKTTTKKSTKKVAED